MRVGIAAVQGDVAEHLSVVRAALDAAGREGDPVLLRTLADLESVQAVIVPGGESTTISRLLDRSGLLEGIRKRGEEGMPVMGTCAGCILLGREGDDQVARTRTKLFGLMDMSVNRNAYGRQRESFEAPLDIEGIGPFRGVFIRAPAIVRTWGTCRPVAAWDGRIVMARQGALWGLAFHPELAGDTRLHRSFLELV